MSQKQRPIKCTIRAWFLLIHLRSQVLIVEWGPMFWLTDVPCMLPSQLSVRPLSAPVTHRANPQQHTFHHTGSACSVSSVCSVTVLEVLAVLQCCSICSVTVCHIPWCALIKVSCSLVDVSAVVGLSIGEQWVHWMVPALCMISCIVNTVCSPLHCVYCIVPWIVSMQCLG